MPDWLWLALQALLAIFMVEQFRRGVLPRVNSLSHPGLILDVWGPLTLAAPALFCIGWIDLSVAGPGWTMVGGPVVCGMLALGAAMAARPPHRNGADQRPVPLMLILSCAGAGLTLLLLGAAHHLTLWTGQCAFAIAAILLWINTPDLIDEPSGTRSTDDDVRAGVAMTAALICSVGQGIAAANVSGSSQRISGALMIGAAAMAVAWAARLTGPIAAVRLGLWVATLGPLLALGMLSLARLAPAAWQILRAGVAPPIDRIAYGFSAFAAEAMVLMLLGLAAAAQSRLPAAPRRMIGLALITLAASLAAWRLARFSA